MSETNQVVSELAARGHRSLLSAQALKLACKLLSVVLLARLVSPTEHGLFAMASSVVLLLALLRDGGLGAAAVQAATLDHTQLNTLFWCHLGIGVTLTIVAVGLAPFAANFYDTPAVTPLLTLMSAAFLLIGAGGFARSQLERSARFKEVAWIEGAAALLGTLAMIATALVHAGAYSFAVYLLVFEAVATGLAWRSLAWRPRASPRFSSIRALFRTGTDLTAYQLLTHLVQQVDAIIVGRIFGAHILGLYNRANQVLALPQVYIATPLNQVALVLLSRLGPDSSGFNAQARNTATVIAHLVLPLFGICAVMPGETVLLILGPQWTDAAPLLRWLAIAAATATITSLGYAINVAAGQTRRLLFSAGIALPVTMGAVWLGVRRGPIGVAESVAIANTALMLPRLWWALRDQPGGLSGYLRALVGPAVATSVFCVVVAVVQVFIGGSHWSLRLSSAGGAGLIGVLLLAIAWPRMRNEAHLVISSLPLPWRRTNRPMNSSAQRKT